MAPLLSTCYSLTLPYAELPHNVLTVDIATFERALFSIGERRAMQDPRTGQLRASGSTLSLGSLLSSLKVDVQCAMHNSGNDAFMSLFALQKLLDPENTPVPDMKARNKAMGIVGMASPGLPMYPSPSMPMMTGPAYTGYAIAAPMPLSINRTFPGAGAAYTNGFLAPAEEFGQMRRSPNLAQRPPSADRRLETGEGRKSMVSG
jgi:hypothetical protein